MMSEELEDLRASKEELVVIEFNPWLYSGTEQITALLFLRLADALPAELGPGRAERLAKRLRSYGAALGTLRSLPGIGGIFGAGAEVAAEAAERIDKSAPDLAGLRAQLAEELRKLGTHIVVIVDDVDRLQSDGEIRDLMRMVKLVGDLPGVTYVLSYDHRPVVASLTSIGVDGQEYLEKIVQVEYRLPEVPRERLMRMLEAAIDAEIVDLAQSRLDLDRWPEVFARIIQPLVTTPRHVRRFANALRLALDLNGDEVDLVDLIALSAIGSLLPGLHRKLVVLQPTLHPGIAFLSQFVPREEKAEAKARLENAAEESGAPEVAKGLFALLFPGTSRILRDVETLGDSRTPRRWRRVSEPEVFWTYMTAALPEGELSVAEVNEAVSSLATATDLAAIVADRSTEQLADLFERLRSHVDDVPSARISTIARFVVEHVRPGMEAPHTINNPARHADWFVVDLLTLMPRDERHEFLMTWTAAASALEVRLAIFEIARYKDDGGDVLAGNDCVERMQAGIAHGVCSAPATVLRSSAAGRLLWLAGSYLAIHDVASLHALLEDDAVFVRYLLVFAEPSHDPLPIQLAWTDLETNLDTEWLSHRLAGEIALTEGDERGAAALAAARRHAAVE